MNGQYHPLNRSIWEVALWNFMHVTRLNYWASESDKIYHPKDHDEAFISCFSVRYKLIAVIFLFTLKSKKNLPGGFIVAVFFVWITQGHLVFPFSSVSIGWGFPVFLLNCTEVIANECDAFERSQFFDSSICLTSDTSFL